MQLMSIFKPKFWDYEDVAAGPFKHLFNFRRIWKQTVFLTLAVTLSPLIFMAAIDYRVSREAIDTDIQLRTARLVSNTRRSVTFFLEERKSALSHVTHDNLLEDIMSHERLADILEHLKHSFGGFTDLGAIDERGIQKAYAGPYQLEGVDYSQEQWYREVLERGSFVSDVFLGVRQTPHFVIAIRCHCPTGLPYVLRATIDTDKFNDLFAGLDVAGHGDVFIINRRGILQTASHTYGAVLDPVPLPVPPFSERSEVIDTADLDLNPTVIGYAYIEDTPFILMICKNKRELMLPWKATQLEILMFLTVSVVAILLVILWGASFLVSRIHDADQKRVATLHQVEYSNKMASIGRLAAGVAHEINNPLAVINEKAGLIKDLFLLKESYAADEKLLGLLDSIIKSVERCGAITRRLLGFARHMGGPPSIQRIEIKDVIHEVLGLLGKEASYRAIEVSVDVPDNLPGIESDLGKIQQVLINLLNNAFAAVSDGGHITVKVRKLDEYLAVAVVDDGCGIPEADRKRIFEPFFSTKTTRGGTGLGLSITYGLIKDLGGEVQVESELGQGTTFTVTLPLVRKPEKGSDNACSVGG
ncbi:MAG: two-component sensor histidine kinase [Syntrophobacteraceae bacterium CG07_land_8_20_14_0_80_61_8]|nr:MAG: two-component sensor histidine kinase [Syntrophobacteraceae bacterium CG07_land_8_20_14_0_80_61_8]